MTKVFASEKSKTEYGHALEQVLPDLQGYDEIHILRREDFVAAETAPTSAILQLEPRQAGPTAHLLGDSDLLRHLKESGDSEQERILKLLQTKAELAKQGPHAYSIETQAGDKPFRVGFIVMVDDAKDKPQTFVLPYGLGAREKPKMWDRLKPEYIQEANDLIFKHEAGHLVQNIREGIAKLTHDDLPRTDAGYSARVHSREIYADNYAASKSDTSAAKVVADHASIRALDGTWEMIEGKGSHFTQPFMTGGVLEQESFGPVFVAGSHIKKEIENESARLFRESKKSLSVFTLTYVGGENIVPYCATNAVEGEKFITALAKRKGEATPSKEDRELRLSESFQECASRFLYYRSQVLSNIQPRFPEDSLERKIIDNYMYALVQSQLAPESRTGQSVSTARKTVLPEFSQ